MFGRGKRKSAVKGPEPELRCSFCNKMPQEVRKLIAGPTVFICDECVQVCQDIIADDTRWAERRHPSTDTAPDKVVVHGTSLLSRCALCELPVVVDEALGIPERGFLCAACADAVEAAIAERKLTS